MSNKKVYNQKHLTTTQRVKMCKSCYDVEHRISKCILLCPEYQEPLCPQIEKAPYVYNGCHKVKRCEKQHAFYSAQQADETSQQLLISCRSGINQEPVDVALLDDLISPLLKQGQSLAHIYAFHGHEIPCCRRTLYNYIDKGVFNAKNIDLLRKVRYKCKQYLMFEHQRQRYLPSPLADTKHI